MELKLLVADRDYPSTYRGFVEMFPDKATCEAYLGLLRWLQGFVCPSCKSNVAPSKSISGRLTCSHRRQRTTISTGTIFDNTLTPLTTWFGAAWHVSAANGLERSL